jgi:uncharacterized membrane protein YfhO
VPIQRADLLVRAVRWPAGRHLLEMSYEPPGVTLGIAVSAVAALVAVALGVWASEASRRRALF